MLQRIYETVSNKLRPIYYDTETTGVKAEEDRIVEIAAYDPVRDETFVSLVRPGVPIPKEASQVHGISDAMVSEAPIFKEVGQKFIDFCEGDVVLIAHNNDGFDRHFLNAEAKRHAFSFPEWPMIDTLKWARKYRPDLPRHSLQFLRQSYGFPENNAHRALDDVITLARVFEAMIDDLSMETILELLSKPLTVDKMPFGKHQGRPLSAVPKNYVSWLKKSGAFDKSENHSLRDAFEKLGLLS